MKRAALLLILLGVSCSPAPLWISPSFGDNGLSFNVEKKSWGFYRPARVCFLSFRVYEGYNAERLVWALEAPKGKPCTPLQQVIYGITPTGLVVVKPPEKLFAGKTYRVDGSATLPRKSFDYDVVSPPFTSRGAVIQQN